MAVYRGHMKDRLTGTSNGNNHAHAFWLQKSGGGSYVKMATTGAPYSCVVRLWWRYLREAANKRASGVVNDGDAEQWHRRVFGQRSVTATSRNEIVHTRIIDGRPGFERSAAV